MVIWTLAFSKNATFLIVNTALLEDMKSYVTKFQWEGAKYPLKQSLKVLAEIIGKVRELYSSGLLRD